MTANPTPYQMSGVTRLHNEIMERIANGSFDPVAVKRQLQAIIERKFTPDMTGYVPPKWWKTPDEQIARARQLWRGVNIPEPPAYFWPNNDREVLLLHVSRPLRDLWDAVTPPPGFQKKLATSLYTPHSVKPSPHALPGGSSARCRWVAFDPKALFEPHSAYSSMNAYAAGGEVLSAMIQFPDWPAMSWKSESSYWYTVVLAGSLHRRDPDESAVWNENPCVRLDARYKELILESEIFLSTFFPTTPRPTVREC